jgi:hypothetical protein
LNIVVSNVLSIVAKRSHGNPARRKLTPPREGDIYCMEKRTTRMNGKISLRAMFEGRASNIDIA